MKFNFFKKAANAVKEVVAPVNTAEVIEAIHNEFDTAADRALEEAMFILSQEGMDCLKKEKCELMEKFGFTGTNQVKQLRERVKIDETAKSKAEIINRYKTNYPQYKFIFKEQVKEICEKYGLICGTANMYKGDIPLKNLKEMEAFKVAERDEYFLMNYSSLMVSSPLAVLNWAPPVISKEQHYKNTKGYFTAKMVYTGDNSDYELITTYHEPTRINYRADDIPFFICAPKKEMDLTGYKLDGVFVKKEWPDPIVLHYVKDGFLIVTKWGIEGDDPILQK